MPIHNVEQALEQAAQVRHGAPAALVAGAQRLMRLREDPKRLRERRDAGFQLRDARAERFEFRGLAHGALTGGVGAGGAFALAATLSGTFCTWMNGTSPPATGGSPSLRRASLIVSTPEPMPAL